MKRLPISLQVLVGLLILEGLWAIVRGVFHWHPRQSGTLDVPLDFVNFFIGVGLLRRRSGWRRFAVVWLWLGVVLTVSCLTSIVLSRGAKADLIVAAYFGAFCLFSLWAIFVLTRPYVIECFESSAGSN